MKIYIRAFMSALLLCLSMWASYPLSAEEKGLDAYFEFGRKGATSLVEEEDLSDEFNYSKYTLKYSGVCGDSSSYNAKYQYYNKGYDTLENLDNMFNMAGLGIDTPLYSTGDFSIKTGPDFEFKEKIYSDAPESNYDQIKFDLPIAFKKKDDWAVKLSGGINSYHYPEAAKDQLKLNSKLETSKKLFDERMDISAFYKFQWVDREKTADRIERTIGAALGLDVGSPFVKKIEGGFERGMDNTIIYEEREDSFDYKYLNWFVKTKHAISNRIKSSVKYTNLARDYADFNHNYGGFILENDWDLRVFEVKDNVLDLKLGYLHKQYRYPYVSNPFAFHNNNIYSGAELARKDDWKVTLDSEVRIYDYPARRTNDKIYYIEHFGIEKFLFKKVLVAGFDYKYTFKNFLHKPDITEDVFRFHVNYKF